MDSLIRSLAQQSGLCLLFLIGALVILTGWCFALRSKQRGFESKWRELLSGPTGASLESLLHEHVMARLEFEKQIAALTQRVNELEDKMQSAKRHVGLVKYDAFEDVGGSQSFAMAIYDDEGNGAVFSAIVGRTDCRIYCKPLLNLRSERDLSQEEQRAIREAREAGPRTIVSR